MKQHLEHLIIGIIASISSYLITQNIPNIQTSSEALQYINHPLIRFMLGVAILWYIVVSIVDRIRRRRSSGPVTMIMGGPPRQIDHIRESGVANRFGVNWEWEYGRQYRKDEPFAIADGPYCPECGAKMMTKKNTRRLRTNIHLWICSSCPFEISRPERHLGNEQEAVEHYVENKIKGPDRFDVLETEAN